VKQQGVDPKSVHRRLAEERRRAERIVVDFEANYSIDPRFPKPARISSLSRSGMQMETLERIPLGVPIKITFHASGAGSTNIAAGKVLASGRAVRLLSETGPPYSYGIENRADDVMNHALLQTFLQLGGSTFEDCLGADEAKQGASADRRLVEERRRFLRVAVDFEARYSATGAASKSSARVTEISRKGLRLLCGQNLSARSLIEISFEPVGRNRRVCVRGQVARLVREVGNQFEYGIAILSDAAVEGTLQWAVLQVGLADASKNSAARI
jgi:hypothetical protein